MTFGLLLSFSDIFGRKRYWNVPYGEFALLLVSGGYSFISCREFCTVLQILILFIMN